MTITIGSWQIADCIVQNVGLQPVMGAYELTFSLRLSVPTGHDGLPRASVLGARVMVQPGQGGARPLGFARPQQPFELVCKDFVDRPAFALHLSLHPSQIAALEGIARRRRVDIRTLVHGHGHGPPWRTGPARRIERSCSGRGRTRHTNISPHSAKRTSRTCGGEVSCGNLHRSAALGDAWMLGRRFSTLFSRA